MAIARKSKDTPRFIPERIREFKRKANEKRSKIFLDPNVEGLSLFRSITTTDDLRESSGFILEALRACPESTWVFLMMKERSNGDGLVEGHTGEIARALGVDARKLKRDLVKLRAAGLVERCSRGYRVEPLDDANVRNVSRSHNGIHNGLEGEKCEVLSFPLLRKEKVLNPGAGVRACVREEIQTKEDQMLGLDDVLKSYEEAYPPRGLCLPSATVGLLAHLIEEFGAFAVIAAIHDLKTRSDKQPTANQIRAFARTAASKQEKSPYSRPKNKKIERTPLEERRRLLGMLDTDEPGPGGEQ